MGIRTSTPSPPRLVAGTTAAAGRGVAGPRKHGALRNLFSEQTVVNFLRVGAPVFLLRVAGSGQRATGCGKVGFEL